MYKIWTACDVIENDIVFQVWSWRHNVGVINSQPIFVKILVNAYPYAKFGVLMVFGLGIR